MADNEADDVPTYEDLEALEDEFEDAELETLRQHTILTKPLFLKRDKVVSAILHFWPLVFEQAPLEIDQFIQPSDSALLMTALRSLWVDRFELDKGEPRSISIRFEFHENEYFEDSMVEKKFWWRHSKRGWAGLISEPVTIKWKPRKDLTGGLMDLVRKVWEEDKAQGSDGKESEAKTQLRKRVEGASMGSLSFFSFFSYCGKKISDDENREAIQRKTEKSQARQQGRKLDEENDDEAEEAAIESSDALEPFPMADELATAIGDDLWPDALKYFIRAQEQEQDTISDVDFESPAEEDELDSDSDEEKPKAKKPRV